MTGQPVPNQPSVSVVIPVLNAAAFLPDLLKAIFAQQPQPPFEVILVDSLSTDRTREIASADARIRVIPISNFSHGRARNLGAREARGDILALLTQDALPAGPEWLERLIAPFADPAVAAVYSRQLPRPDTAPMERFFLLTHFPDGAPTRREKGGKQYLGLEDVFFSNVSAAVRRDVLLKFPFDEELIMSEDQQFARDILNAGYATVYQPSSVVIHSHRYTLTHVFRRYFDSVYSLTKIFSGHDFKTSASMGIRYVFREMAYIARNYPCYLMYYLLYNIAKASGTVAAHFADRMPRWMARKCSLHRYYWNEPS
jgi:rhamnosyltransferase